MFDLEQSIDQWRKRMLAAGVKTLPLEELETHLREDFQKQVKLGMLQPDALKIAITHIGTGEAIRAEFKKAGEPMGMRFVKLTGLASVTVAFSLSLYCLPFLMQSGTSLLIKLFGLAGVVTTALCWKISHFFLPVVRQPAVRTAIGLAGCLGCIVWIQLFIVYFFPYVMTHPVGIGRPEGGFLAVSLWGWAVMAVLGSVGSGLEKAAHRQHWMIAS